MADPDVQFMEEIIKDIEEENKKLNFMNTILEQKIEKASEIIEKIKKNRKYIKIETNVPTLRTIVGWSLLSSKFSLEALSRKRRFSQIKKKLIDYLIINQLTLLAQLVLLLLMALILLLYYRLKLILVILKFQGIQYKVLLVLLLLLQLIILLIYKIIPM